MSNDQNCKAEGCEKPRKQRGYCWTHYYRLRRHGDLNFRERRANGEGGLTGDKVRMRFSLADGRRVQEAVVVAERALGKPLPKGAVVHHVNEDPLDCRNKNLVILQNQGMHNILHGRLKALQATGNAHAKPCKFCHKYDDPALLIKTGTSHYHRECGNRYSRSLAQRRKQISVSP